MRKALLPFSDYCLELHSPVPGIIWPTRFCSWSRGEADACVCRAIVMSPSRHAGIMFQHPCASGSAKSRPGRMTMRTSIAICRLWPLAGAIAIALATASPADAQDATKLAPAPPPRMDEAAHDRARTAGLRYAQLAEQRRDADDNRDSDGRDRDDTQRRRDQLYWFAPLYAYVTDGAGGVKPLVQLDYMNVFTADSPWARARSHIRIVKIYPQLVDFGPDSAMSTIFAYLNQNHLALGLEYGPLTATAQCGQNVEGYSAGPSD